MTKIARPRVFRIASTAMEDEGLDGFLDHIGAGNWTTDAEDDASLLTEVAGRACYRSFGEGLNKNVTRTRQGNHNYIGNGILASKHGSVLEHSTVTYAICDVSRVVTHELVRHRQGTAFSQESGRFVRVDDIRYYTPHALSDNEFLKGVYDELVAAGHLPAASDFHVWAESIRDGFENGMKRAEEGVALLESQLGLDHLSSFGSKKKLQSAIRRIAPNGMGNTLIMTANHRAWRHICSVRTDAAAEEEIRSVQYQIFLDLEKNHPAIYQDADLVYDEGMLPSSVPAVSFQNEKV